LNKVRTTQRWSESKLICQRLLESPRIQACALGEMQQADAPVAMVMGRIAAVILAAGQASRMGQLKQLMGWKGKPLLWYSVQTAKIAGLDPVVVVIGSGADEVQGAFAGEALRWVRNPDWTAGQSTSLVAGLRAVEESSEAVVFFLADMPLIPAELVQALVTKHRTTLAPIVAPRADGRRANPVLFDRATYSALKALRGDVGGRQLFNQYSPAWIEWEQAAFTDIDTPEDLNQLASRGGKQETPPG
jgi:molybdenum cofactor cytidylyltransferase